MQSGFASKGFKGEMAENPSSEPEEEGFLCELAYQSYPFKNLEYVQH